MTAFARIIAPYALAAVLGAFLWTWAPFVGPAARYARLERHDALAVASAAEWKRHTLGWMASYRLSESRRASEVQTSQAAASILLRQCAVQVTQARQSARAIERIVTTEPTYDENRCPARQLVDPRSLREALQPSG